MILNAFFTQIKSVQSHTKTAISCVIISLFIIIGCQKPSTPQEEAAANMVDAEAKLKELGITLPQPPKPVANYVNAVRTGNLIFLAGKGPKRADDSEITGKLGREISIEEGYEAARLTAINQLSVLKAELGDKTISHYRILEKLGEGGMGVAYKAEHMRLDRLAGLQFFPQVQVIVALTREELIDGH